MEAGERKKRADRQNSARMLGLSELGPRFRAGQHMFQAHQAEIMKLPGKTAGALQIMDPGDPDFGKFYFMVGYDDLGGDAPLG